MVKDGFMNWVYIEMRIENVTKREREEYSMVWFSGVY